MILVVACLLINTVFFSVLAFYAYRDMGDEDMIEAKITFYASVLLSAFNALAILESGVI
jgi:hypothetical protein